jgi:hypothetical protein
LCIRADRRSDSDIDPLLAFHDIDIIGDFRIAAGSKLAAEKGPGTDAGTHGRRTKDFGIADIPAARALPDAPQ